MTKEKKKNMLIIGAIILFFFIISRKKTGGKNISVSEDFILEGYADLVNSSSYLTFEGVGLHVWLARNTQDYATVKAAYESVYGGNLTYKLIESLSNRKESLLPEFVAELYANGGQQLFA